MSQENVEVVKAVHPPSGTDLKRLVGMASDDPRWLEPLSSLLTDDFEAVGGDHFGAGLAGLGYTASGRGVGGLLAAWRDWLDPWDTYWTEVEAFVDADDDHVVVLVRDHGRPLGSDSEVENIGASVWTLRSGRVARIEFHANRGQALKAVGLEE